MSALQNVQYEIRESARARTMSVTVHPDGRVVAIKPRFTPEFVLRTWLAGREAWIEEMQEKFIKSAAQFERKHGKPETLPKLRRGSKDYLAAVKKAREIVTERVHRLARLEGFSYGAISIRNQKTRWGSCSARGNLSFNYRIVYLPQDVLDYLIVHELAHTKHHNHSARFWAEVAVLIPEYKKLRSQLHRYRF